jgi:ubiquinone/menaquinone biosynthesis C-methylase UbiE
MAESRAPQLAYSELESAMLDEAKRRRKAAKLISVLQHFLGRSDLAGLTVADIGCSAGFISDELAAAGAARTLGIDIDVPGLRRAHDRFGERVGFVCGDGSRLPFPDDTFDALVFNHIYEHVVDPEAVVAELRRVLSPTGVLYLGLANRFGPIEPHYRLPFLSYLPPALADRYVRVTRRADQCHERLRSRRSLARMLEGLHVWDYTYSVLAEPGRFAGEGDLPGAVTRLPMPVQKALRPIVPTYIWVATKTPQDPRGPGLAEPPVRV